MTIGTAGNRVSLNCDGATKVFPVNLQAYLAGDFTVILTAPAAAGGGQTTLVLNSDFSLATSSTDAPPKWTLTTLAANAYLAGYSLQAFVNPSQVQQTSYVQGQAFPSLAMQTNLDRLTQMVQRVEDQVSRAVRAPDGDVSPLLLMPPAGQRALMNLTTDVNGNIALSQALAAGTLSAASIGAFLYPQTAAEIASAVTPTLYYYPPGDIRRYGAAVNGVTDDLAAINKAILVSAAGGTPATAPGGTIFHSAAITMKALACLRGAGKDSTVFLSSHTGAGIVTTSTLNGSTGVYTEIRDCRFQNSNGSNTNGGVVDIAGSEVIVRNVSTLGFKYGMIFDQSELADIYLCEIANFLSTGGGIWLTNGADYSVGSNPGFTNRISVRSCQINGGLGGVGIIDDGGVAHSFVDNNFNACATHIRVCGSTVPSGPGTSVRIADNEFETNTANSIIFGNTTYVLGTARGFTTNAVIDRNFFSPGAFFSVSIAVSSLYALQFSNNHTISSAPTVSGTANLNSLMAFDNIDSNAGVLFDGTANSHIETGVVNTTTTIKNTNLTLIGAVAVTGTLSSSSRAQFNGAAGAALVTGFGTPTGTGVVANFPGASATLAQATQTIAELILILKNTGILGA